MLGKAKELVLKRFESGSASSDPADWITFPNFAVFNLADSAIVGSAALMVLLALRGIEIDGSRA